MIIYISFGISSRVSKHNEAIIYIEAIAYIKIIANIKCIY